MTIRCLLVLHGLLWVSAGQAEPRIPSDCIALSQNPSAHLHQIPTPAQFATIGRLDVVIVPVDGAFTRDVADMADVVRHLHPSIVLPMRWFSPEGLARFQVQLNPVFTITVPDTA